MVSRGWLIPPCPRDAHDGRELHRGKTVSRSKICVEISISSQPSGACDHFSETSPERASVTPLVASKKITLAEGASVSLVAVCRTEPSIPRRKRPLVGYPVSFLSTRREKFPVLQYLPLPCTRRREPVAHLLFTRPRRPRGPLQQVPM